MTQFYPQFEAHLADKNTLSLYDVQHLLNSDDISEAKELFTKYAFSKRGSQHKRHFMVTNLEECSSQIVCESELNQMRLNDQVDDACLMYVVKTSSENDSTTTTQPSPLTASCSQEPFTQQIAFLHAPQVFHQNMLTKNLGGAASANSSLNSAVSSLALGNTSKSGAVTQPQIRKTIPSAKAGSLGGAKLQGATSQQAKLQTVPKQEVRKAFFSTERTSQDTAMAEEKKSSAAAAVKQIGFADDSEQIPAATKKEQADNLKEDDVEMMPTRRRANKKRRVRQESSVDEDELDIAMDEQSPAARVLQPMPEESNMQLSEEKTAATPLKPPHEATQGKKWAKVKKTEQTMDDKGYMVFKDVEVWEEVDDIKPAKRAPAKSAGVKAQGAVAQTQKKAGTKVQSGLGAFFKQK